VSLLDGCEPWRAHIEAGLRLVAALDEKQQRVDSILADFHTQLAAWEERRDVAAGKGRSFAEPKPICQLGDLDWLEHQRMNATKQWVDAGKDLLLEIAPDIERAAREKSPLLLAQGRATPIRDLGEFLREDVQPFLHDLSSVRPAGATLEVKNEEDLAVVLLRQVDLTQWVGRPDEGQVQKATAEEPQRVRRLTPVGAFGKPPAPPRPPNRGREI
jgi:hypothetical protein